MDHQSQQLRELFGQIHSILEDSEFPHAHARLVHAQCKPIEQFICATMEAHHRTADNPSTLIARDLDTASIAGRRIHAAGEGFNDKHLGTRLRDNNCGTHEAAEVVSIARRRKARGPKLASIAPILDRPHADKDHIFNDLRQSVKEANARHEAAHPQPDPQPELLLRANGDKYVHLTLKNIPRTDAQILRDFFANYRDYDPDVESHEGENSTHMQGDTSGESVVGLPTATASQVYGAAAIHALRAAITSSGQGQRGRITSVFVISPDATIYSSSGQILSAEEFAALRHRWGVAEDYGVITDEMGKVVSFTQARVANKAQRIILQAEQGGCVFPHCDKAGQEVHHLIPHSHGGATELGNLALLCSRHHSMVGRHPYGFILDRHHGMSSFTDKDGIETRGIAYQRGSIIFQTMASAEGYDLSRDDHWHSFTNRLIRQYGWGSSR